MWDIWIPCVISEGYPQSQSSGCFFRWIQSAYDHVFAAPLGVGTESLGEYFDLELAETVPTSEITRRLDAVMVEGVHVLSTRQVEDGKAGKAMSLVAAADYYVEFRPGKEPEISWKDKISDFLAQPEIKVMKKTKRSEKEIDIRPFIYKMELQETRSL